MCVCITKCNDCSIKVKKHTNGENNKNNIMVLIMARYQRNIFSLFFYILCASFEIGQSIVYCRKEILGRPLLSDPRYLDSSCHKNSTGQLIFISFFFLSD